jgi:DtxR family Mn-dependent transcriptional regulator
VEYEPYRGAALTGKGMALAQKVVRKHRLIERLLHDVLKIPYEKIHVEACKLEHGLSDETAAALCKALENPEFCPDEAPIPVCNLNVEDCSQCELAREAEGEEFPLVTQLSNLKPGEEAEVTFFRGGRNACQRIMDMGLTPGTRIKVTAAAPFRGPIEVEVRNTSVALGRSLASQVFVKVDDEDQAWRRDHPHGPHHK